MKKITSLLLVLLFILMAFAACGDDKEGTSSNIDSSEDITSKSELSNSSDTGDESEISEPASEPDESKPEESAIYSMSLEDIVKAVYASSGKTYNSDDYYNTEVTKETLVSYFGADFEFTDAFASELSMGFGYSFCLARVNEEDAEEIAALVEEKADLAKWVCTGAQAKITAVNGNVVMLCMSTNEECNQLAEAFKAIK